MSQIDLQWFAAEDEGKTEEPSEYKLRKAREEGQIPKSQELNGVIVFLITSVLLIFLAPWVERNLEEMCIFFFKASTEDNIVDGKFAYAVARYFLFLVMPFAFVGLIAGVSANLIQNRGFIFTTKTIEPKFNKILPHFGQYLKRTIFSFEGVFNIIKSILKVFFIAIIAFVTISSDLPIIFKTLHVGGLQLALKHFASMAVRLLLMSGIVLFIAAIADYIVQRRQFREQMKMTKQEVKEEFKSMEGDPEVKAHLDSAQREMLSQNIPKAVKEADVVITNPTHFAVALQWKREVSDAPEVTAKGQDLTAQNIKRIAKENDVPIVENRPLARGLYADTEVGDIIPVTYLRAIATVYAQIGYMNRQRN